MLYSEVPMDYLKTKAAERNVPSILTFNNGAPVKDINDFELRRKEIKALLEEHEYGCIPEKPNHMEVDEIDFDKRFCAGKAPLRKLKFTVTFEDNRFSFPVMTVIPDKEGKLPAFVHINLRPDVPDKHMPSEEIADRGYAVFSFCYNDVTKDNKNFKSGVAKYLVPSRKKQNAPGKIAIWAWAAMRVVDYIQTLDTIDKDNIAVIGHSRLGIAALLAGAFDDRFKYVISNNSGCSGAAVLRGKTGENLSVLVGVRPYWFCPRYADYTVFENNLPLDQHFLLAASAPRHLLIGSAHEDTWADPESEFISSYLAGEVYEKIYGIPGLIHENKIPEPKTVLDKGNICYHIRKGFHYLSREDWNVYMDYIDKCMEKFKIKRIKYFSKNY